MPSIGGNVALVSDYMPAGTFGAICTDCLPIIPLPFPGAVDRDTWVNTHRNSTQHNVIVVDGPQVEGVNETPAA